MTQIPIRVAIIMDHPAQQFTRGLQLLASMSNVDVRVYYWSVSQQIYDPDFDKSISWDTDLLSGYHWNEPKLNKSLVRRAYWLITKIREARPDAVVCYGWASLISRISITCCILTRIPIILYGDSTWQHSAGGRYRILRSVALRMLMHLSSGAISTGTFNREFYIRHGMPPDRIWHGVCPADTAAFEVARSRQSGYGIDRDADQLRIGFAGKLIPRKGVDNLLRAAALMPRAGNWSLSIIGVGPQMTELRQFAERACLGDKVRFHGFANTSEMPKLLGCLDVLVIPSRLDMRVLISIEAMAAGAAVVVSDATAIWGPGDLIEHGVTGLVYPSDDHVALAQELTRLLNDRFLLASLQNNGLKRVAAYRPEEFARTTALAVRACLELRKASY